MMRWVAPLLVLLALMLPLSAMAHEVRPALLELAETEPDQWRITWKQPVMGERALRLKPHLSNGWLDRTPADEELTGTHYLRRWEIAAPASQLEGARLRIGGLDKTITDVLVRIQTRHGDASDTILTRNRPEMLVQFEQQGGLAVPAYLGLGVEHILTGADHLLFVLGLILLVGTGWRLVSAITSFTIAHSLTLAASALGLVNAPVQIIEALIALSIVYVAFELTRSVRSGESLAVRRPWLVALPFGLLHGFGFAGALAETGLPQDAIPMSLLLFNVGVEIGQLLFIGAVLLIMLAWRWLSGPLRLSQLGQKALQPAMIHRLAAYAIGCYASFLVFERTASAFA